MTFDIQAAIAEAAETAPDLREATAGGGGEYTLPEAGLCVATLIGYIEIGEHESEYKGVKKTKKKAQFIFELAGGKNQPKVLDDGTKIPHRITVTENVSQNAKAGYFKLFTALNHDGQARHFAQLLGRHYLVTIHRTTSGEGDKKREYANLWDDNGYTLRAPYLEQGDPLAGDVQLVPVNKPEIISALRLFVWQTASKPMWDSLFIDGEYEAKPAANGKPALAAKSKNVIQNKIRSALNWKGSPMQQILEDGELNLDPLVGAGADVATPAATTASVQTAAASASAQPSSSASADPLAGLI